MADKDVSVRNIAGYALTADAATLGFRVINGYALTLDPKGLPKGVTGIRAILDLVVNRALAVRPITHFTAEVPEVLTNDPNYNSRVKVKATTESKLTGEMYFRYNRALLGRLPIVADRFSLGTATSVLGLLPALNTVSGMVLTADDLEDAAIAVSATTVTLVAKSTSRFFVPGSTLKVGLFAEPDLWIDPSNLAANDTVIYDRSRRGAVVTNVGTRVADVGPKPGMKSIYFPNDKVNYLRVASGTTFNILTGDFTIEYWELSESRAVLAPVVAQWAQISGYGGFHSYRTVNGGRGFTWGASNENADMMVNDLPANSPMVWTHTAITREGNVFKQWRDGVVVGTVTQAAVRAATGLDIGIGGYYGRSTSAFPQENAGKFNGWIADLKISTYCKYNKTFTP